MELSPQERALMQEGNNMLKAIAASQPQKSGLVGPDGRPVETDTPIDPKAELERMRKERDAQYDQNTKELEELFRGSPDLKRMADGLLALYRACHWITAEILAQDGVKKPLVNDLAKRIHAAAMQNKFDLGDVIAHIQTNLLPLMKDKRRHYKAEQGRRNNKLQSVIKVVGPEGIKLPGTEMNKAIGHKFICGMLVLRGSAYATQQLLKEIESDFFSKYKELPARIKAAPSGEGEDYASFFDYTKHIHESSSLLVLVDNIEDLGNKYELGEGKQVPTDEERTTKKASILSNILQLAEEKQVAFVVCDTTGSMPGLYEGVPAVNVTVNDVGHLLVNEEPIS
jgi:hypothetical protein